MSGQPAEKTQHQLLRDALDYVLPGPERRPLGHVVLRRDQAEAIYQEWIESERDRTALQNSVLGMSDAVEVVGS